MDFLTLLGLLSGIGIVLGAIASGSSLLDFVNLPGLMIVVFGTLSVTLVKYRWANLVNSFSLAFNTAFTERTKDPLQLYKEVRNVAEIVRKQGVLGLEQMEIHDAFLQRAVDLGADGHPPEFLEDVLLQDTHQTVERLQTAEKVFRGIGDSAPALGMLGTLVGLVQMLNNMSAPETIGPAMAIALLTTFYGAFIAQVIALPLADKLQQKTLDEVRNRMMVISSMLSMLQGLNPRVLKDILASYLPELISLPDAPVKFPAEPSDELAE
jgi:chemotaxis protein MotA